MLIACMSSVHRLRAFYEKKKYERMCDEKSICREINVYIFLCIRSSADNQKKIPLVCSI